MIMTESRKKNLLGLIVIEVTISLILIMFIGLGRIGSELLLVLSATALLLYVLALLEVLILWVHKTPKETTNTSAE